MALLTPIWDLVNPVDPDLLRDQIRRSTPVRNFLLDNFLTESFANRVADAFPSYAKALAKGRSFSGMNECGKVQVTDSAHFPEAIAQLNALLASKEFCELIGYVLELPDLLADDQLVGGGMHQTSAPRLPRRARRLQLPGGKTLVSPGELAFVLQSWLATGMGR